MICQFNGVESFLETRSRLCDGVTVCPTLSIGNATQVQIGTDACRDVKIISTQFYDFIRKTIQGLILCVSKFANSYRYCDER